MSRPWLIVSACLLASAMASAPACTSTKETAPASGAKTAVAAAPINAECPMSGEPVDAKAGGSVVYKGQTVAFCCAKCAGKFAALDDAGKSAALAEHGAPLPK